MSEVERPESAPAAPDDEVPVSPSVPETPAGDEEDQVLTPADLREKAKALHGNVFRRDFAYPQTDPRHWCLPYEGARDGDQSGSEGDFLDQSMDAFDDSTSSLGSNFSTGWGRNKQTVEVNCNQLLAELDLARMLESKLFLHQFTFTKAKAMYEFQGVTEWEMTIREGEGILLLDRRPEGQSLQSLEDIEMSKNLLSPLLANIAEPGPSEDRTASIDSPKPLPAVAIYLRPRSFALDLDRFLDYRRLYPDGWSLGLKVKIKVKGRVNRRVNAQGRTKVRLDKDGKLRVRVKLVDKGLVPTNYVEMHDPSLDTPVDTGSGDEQAALGSTVVEGLDDAAEPHSEQPPPTTSLLDEIDELADSLAPLSVEQGGDLGSAGNSDDEAPVDADALAG